MRLSILPALALTASCATNVPEVKPTKILEVELQTAQTRADLLEQLGVNHEGSQDNGAFVYCTSDGDRQQVREIAAFPSRHENGEQLPPAKLIQHIQYYTRYSSGYAAGENVCERTLNCPNELVQNMADMSQTTVFLDDLLNGTSRTFSSSYWCTYHEREHSEHVACTVPLFLKNTAINTSTADDACIYVEIGEVSTKELPPEEPIRPQYIR